MMRKNGRSLFRNTNIKPTIGIFVGLLIVSGIAGVQWGSNHVLYTVANAQIENNEESREEQRAAAVEEELYNSQEPEDTSSASPNGISVEIDRAQYIPLAPLSDSPGNQVKVLLGYSVEDPSQLKDDTINAVMEVYSANQTLLRTSSLPEPLALDDSDGSIQLATTFDDPALQNVTVKALLTDGQKIFPLSEPIEENIGLGEIRTADLS